MWQQWAPSIILWDIWGLVWNGSSQTRYHHLFLIVPLTAVISLWAATKMGFYCLLGYPVLHKGPLLNSRGEVFIFWHYMMCVNTRMISSGSMTEWIFTPRRQVEQEGNNFFISSIKSFFLIEGDLCLLTLFRVIGQIYIHMDVNVSPKCFLKERHCFLFFICACQIVICMEQNTHVIWLIAVLFQVYRQDCETFGMVVKMLVAKDPNLEKQVQVPLRENLGEIRERCLEDLKHFISELDEAVRQPEPSVCDSITTATALTGHKLSKNAVNHSSSYWHTGLICPLWDWAW